MRGIVFDFFGTLTDPAAEAGREALYAETAAALGVPADAFWAAVSASFPERATGVHGGTRDTLRVMARRCGAETGEAALDAATAVHLANAELVRRPRPGVLNLLDRLRADGFRIGLISDCSSELCEAWPQTPYASRMDAAVFSWEEGYLKPDSRLYGAVSARLGLSPAECWYVGDGGSRELDGALRAGMRPVLVANTAHPGAAAFRNNPDAYRPALVIDDLDGLLTVL